MLDIAEKCLVLLKLTHSYSFLNMQLQLQELQQNPWQEVGGGNFYTSTKEHEDLGISRKALPMGSVTVELYSSLSSKSWWSVRILSCSICVSGVCILVEKAKSVTC